jgi:hypothetical protein
MMGMHPDPDPRLYTPRLHTHIDVCTVDCFSIGMLCVKQGVLLSFPYDSFECLFFQLHDHH